MVPARRSSGRVFERLERCGVPTADDIDLLVREVRILSEPGQIERARALLRRWRLLGCRDPDLGLAEAMLTASDDGEAATHSRQLLADPDPQAASLEVVSRTYRGDLHGAIELARSLNWFLDSLEATEGLCSAVFALGLTGQVEQAEAVIEAWKHHFAGGSPEKYQMILGIESRIARFQLQFQRELSLVEDAHALCTRHGLDVARSFLEPVLVCALARCGYLQRAEHIMSRWAADGRGRQGPLDGFRNRSRSEIALLQGRHGQADRHGRRALAFYQSVNYIPLICEMHFYLVLSAPPSRAQERLEHYRRATHRHQLEIHLRRLVTLESLLDGGRICARTVRVTARSRRASERLPLVRLWTPPLAWVSADLYWDRMRDMLLIQGQGPCHPGDHPVLRRLMEALLSTPGFSLPMAALYQAVWQGEFNPLIHEGKVHVTIHRLRRWMDRHCKDAGSMIEVHEGTVRLAPSLDVRVVSPPTPAGRVPESTGVPLAERVVQTLQDGAALAPRTLERRLGISRTGLHHAVRRLLADGRIERTGRGPATRYRLLRVSCFVHRAS